MGFGDCSNLHGIWVHGNAVMDSGYCAICETHGSLDEAGVIAVNVWAESDVRWQYNVIDALRIVRQNSRSYCFLEA